MHNKLLEQFSPAEKMLFLASAALVLLAIVIVLLSGGAGRLFFRMTADEPLLCRQVISQLQRQLATVHPAAVAYCIPDYEQEIVGDPDGVRIFGLASPGHSSAFMAGIRGIPQAAALRYEFYEKENFWMEWVALDAGGERQLRWRGPEKLLHVQEPGQ